MMSIRTDHMELSVSEDGASVVLRNLRTGSPWVLDPATMLADGSGQDRVSFGSDQKRGSGTTISEAASRTPSRSGTARPRPWATARCRSAGAVRRANSCWSTNLPATAAA